MSKYIVKVGDKETGTYNTRTGREDLGFSLANLPEINPEQIIILKDGIEDPQEKRAFKDIVTWHRRYNVK